MGRAWSPKADLHLCQIYGHGRFTDLYGIYSFELTSEPVQCPKYRIAITIFLGCDPQYYLALHLISQNSWPMTFRVINQAFYSVFFELLDPAEKSTRINAVCPCNLFGLEPGKAR